MSQDLVRRRQSLSKASKTSSGIGAPNFDSAVARASDNMLITEFQTIDAGRNDKCGGQSAR